jgi:hypothetical protein
MLRSPGHNGRVPCNLLLFNIHTCNYTSCHPIFLCSLSEQEPLPHARLQVATKMIRKVTIFWDLAPCNQVVVKCRFRGKYCLHLQGRRVSQASNKLLAAYFLLITWLTLRLGRGQYVPPKRPWTTNIQPLSIKFRDWFNMLGNSGKRCSKYGKFYDSPVLLTLVRWTGQEPLVNKVNFVFLTDSVSELYGQRLYYTASYTRQ